MPFRVKKKFRYFSWAVAVGSKGFVRSVSAAEREVAVIAQEVRVLAQAVTIHSWEVSA